MMKKLLLAALCLAGVEAAASAHGEIYVDICKDCRTTSIQQEVFAEYTIETRESRVFVSGNSAVQVIDRLDVRTRQTIEYNYNARRDYIVVRGPGVDAMMYDCCITNAVIEAGRGAGRVIIATGDLLVGTLNVVGYAVANGLCLIGKTVSFVIHGAVNLVGGVIRGVGSIISGIGGAIGSLGRCLDCPPPRPRCVRAPCHQAPYYPAPQQRVYAPAPVNQPITVDRLPPAPRVDDETYLYSAAPDYVK